MRPRTTTRLAPDTWRKRSTKFWKNRGGPGRSDRSFRRGGFQARPILDAFFCSSKKKNFFGFSLANPCYRPAFFVASTQTAGLQSWCWWQPFFEPMLNEQGALLVFGSVCEAPPDGDA